MSLNIMSLCKCLSLSIIVMIVRVIETWVIHLNILSELKMCLQVQLPSKEDFKQTIQHKLTQIFKAAVDLRLLR